jgi:NAD(P)-dependent dehydrogenase (short-subunit alcohol dehydrogenase family)
MDEGRLAGKTALVTGGGRGNGRAIALALAREGTDVAVHYVEHAAAAEEVAAAVRALGRRSLVVRAHVARRPEVQAMVEEVYAAWGRLDVLVNNAGVLKRTPFLEIGDAEWDWTIDVNLRGYFVVGQTVARRMVAQGGGAIVNISSVGQKLAGRNVAHYCVSKAGVGMLTKAMALELAPHGVRVNAVCPGTVVTDINREDAARPEWVEAQYGRLAVRAMGEPEDVAGAVVFLAAEQESRLAVGTSIYLDNGKSIW